MAIPVEIGILLPGNTLLVVNYPSLKPWVVDESRRNWK